MAHPLIIAHRGGSMAAPENTLGAFRHALALGVDGIELDARVTRDGVAVVFHDATLGRLTSGRGPVARRTWKDLRALAIRGADKSRRIPSLVETLSLTRGRLIVQIEVKPGVPVAPVIRAVQRARAADGVILASFDRGILHESQRLAPTVPRMLISEGPRKTSSPERAALALLRQMAAVGASGVSLNYRAIRSPVLVETLRRHGASLWCWTVNDAPAMRRLARWGVNAILSDDPARLKQTLEKLP